MALYTDERASPPRVLLGDRDDGQHVVEVHWLAGFRKSLFREDFRKEVIEPMRNEARGGRYTGPIAIASLELNPKGVRRAIVERLLATRR